MKNLKRSGITILGLVIIASITAALGILLLGVTAGFFNKTIFDLTKETSENIQEIRSVLVIEYATCDLDSNQTKFSVRNVGMIDLTITRIELRSPQGEIYNSIPEGTAAENMFTNITKVVKDENATLSIGGCVRENGGTVILRVWYISSSLFDPDNPGESMDKMSYLDLVLESTPAVSPLTCPIPDNWILMDFVDPISYVTSGTIARDYVRIRVPLASEPEEVSVTVTVQQLPSGATRSGSGTIDSISNEVQVVDADASGLHMPVKITFSPSGGWVIIPGEWTFGGIPYQLHVSDILLVWDETKRVVYAALVSLGVGSSGTYRVSITLKDCNGDVIASGQTIVTPVSVGGVEDTWIEFNPVRFDQIYYVETEVVRVT